MALAKADKRQRGLSKTPNKNNVVKNALKDRSHFKKISKPHQQPKALMPFYGKVTKALEDKPQRFIEFDLKDYLELVEWTGRAQLANKRGFIPEGAPSILAAFDIKTRHWLALSQSFRHVYSNFAGSRDTLEEHIHKRMVEAEALENQTGEKAKVPKHYRGNGWRRLEKWSKKGWAA